LWQFKVEVPRISHVKSPFGIFPQEANHAARTTITENGDSGFSLTFCRYIKIKDWIGLDYTPKITKQHKSRVLIGNIKPLNGNVLMKSPERATGLGVLIYGVSSEFREGCFAVDMKSPVDAATSNNYNYIQLDMRYK